MGQGAKAGGKAQTSDAGQSFHKAVCPRHGNRLAEAKAMVSALHLFVLVMKVFLPRQNKWYVWF
jgi:hypothetical protein